MLCKSSPCATSYRSVVLRFLGSNGGDILDGDMLDTRTGGGTAEGCCCCIEGSGSMPALSVVSVLLDKSSAVTPLVRPVFLVIM